MSNYFKMNAGLSYVDDEHVAKNQYLKINAQNEEIPKYETVKGKLPIPVWYGHKNVIDCYYKTWSIAWRNLRKANAEAGFVSNFIDSAFNDYLFMWDSSFIVMFGKYAHRYFDFQKTLDNFYSHQHRDGFICREIAELIPGEQWQRDDPASTGPNILPWAEWEYYLSTGDKERLARVFDPLCAYHNWLRLNRSWKDGTYWSCGLACGMDNCPRQEKGYDDHASHGFMSWIDTCAQMNLSANILIQMGEVLGRQSETESYKAEAEMLKKVINENMWDEKTSYYYDMFRNGKLSGIKSLASYWTLLAGIVPPERAEKFVSHLDNEKEFKRPNRIPTLSADNPLYNADGGYWRGGVWAPTNYMTLCGLRKYGYDKLAYEIAGDYLSAVIAVYEKHGTVFENYAPEKIDIGICGWPAKADFVGWTGLAPISILFEYVFGLQPDARNKKLIWNINVKEKHGIMQYPLGDATVDIICEKRKSADEKPVIKLNSDKPITLEVHYGQEVIYYKDITVL